MFMNIALIWVTITKSKFHGTSNILLAQCAFYEIIHEIGILIMFYFNLMGINFLTYSQTVAVFFIPIFAASGIGPLFVFTGLDRMLCVIFPTFPNQIRPRIYLTLISVICASYCAIFPVGFYWFNNIDPDTLVPPTFNDIFSVLLEQFTHILALFFIILQLFYMWLLVFWLKLNQMPLLLNI
uniref:G_PROTEIN_RECEP_F1_2 domain-containing protein n=1 Tax=Meloidogyne incognita TaxID=6306 RepID=A0A914LBA9_MELIC